MRLETSVHSTVRVEDKRQGPPKLHDLPSLQKPLRLTLRLKPKPAKHLVAQELYDGQGKKIITIRAPGALPAAELNIGRARIVAGLRVGQSFGAIPITRPPVIRRSASGSFYDKGLDGASHHAFIPKVNTIDKLPQVWPRLSSDETQLFDVIARKAYLARLMPDFRYRPDNRNARRTWFPNSELPAVSPSISAGAQLSRTGSPATKGRRGAITAATAQRRDRATARSKNRGQRNPSTAALQ